jgi:hypothetical protein
MKYTKQAGRSFSTCFQEHLRDFKYGNDKSTFAQPPLQNGHAIGPMEEIMDTIQFTNKGRLMNTLEKFYIFRETKLNNQINDKLTPWGPVTQICVSTGCCRVLVRSLQFQDG